MSFREAWYRAIESCGLNCFQAHPQEARRGTDPEPPRLFFPITACQNLDAVELVLRRSDCLLDVIQGASQRASYIARSNDPCLWSTFNADFLRAGTETPAFSLRPAL